MIESNITYPTTRHTRFHSMKVGDSFPITEDERERYQGLAGYYRRKHGMKFSIRKVEGGIRMWRTA